LPKTQENIHDLLKLFVAEYKP